MPTEQEENASYLENLVKTLRADPTRAAAMAPALRKLRRSIGGLGIPTGEGVGVVHCAGHCIGHCVSHPPASETFMAGTTQPA